MSDPWVSHSMHHVPRTGAIEETVIKGLEFGVPYKVRTVLIDSDFNSYKGDDIPVAHFIPLCTIPERPAYHIESESNETACTVTWVYPENEPNCPVKEYEVSWREGWKWLTRTTNDTYIVLSDLLPSTTIKFKVRALTYKGFASYSPVVLVSTKSSALTAAVENLRIKTVASRRVEIQWNPPHGTYDRDLSYLVMYKCLRQIACDKSCEESAGEIDVTNTKVTLTLLYPLSQYLVTVVPEHGTPRSLTVGTKMSAPEEIPKQSTIPLVRTNTSITVYWDKPDVCSGLFTNYFYQLHKVGDVQAVVETGSTVNTNVSFDNLEVSTDYRVLVYVQTTFGDMNSNRYLEINVSTSATVPERVQNLTIYKQGRYMLGLRWTSPNNTYGPIVSFTIKYGYEGNQDYKTETIKPTPCIAWPQLFCHTINYLRADKTYKVIVSARNSQIDADGASVEVTGLTREKSPGAPENLKVLNSTSSSIFIQWNHPWMANGIIRSFLISIEETEHFEEEKCCKVYPIIETIVTDEQKHYSVEVASLNAASTYVVSVSAKTAAMGSPNSITVHTRPPPLPISQLPNVTVTTNNCHDVLTWLPQKLNLTANLDVYKSLIKGSLLLVLSNYTDLNSSHIRDKKLDNELKALITEVFYLAAEYTNTWPGGTCLELGTGENRNGIWGEIHNLHFHQNTMYQVVIVQVSEYCGVYGIDTVWSSPFVVTKESSPESTQ